MLTLGVNCNIISVMGSNINEMLSVTQVAKLLNISRTHVIRLIKQGSLSAKKIGNSYVISKDDLPGIYRSITATEKKLVEEAVDEIFEKYGDVIRKLGDA